MCDTEHRYNHSLCLSAEEKVEIIATRKGGVESYIKKFECFYSKEKIDFESIWNQRYFFCDEDGAPTHHDQHYGAAFDVHLGAMAELQMLIDQCILPPLPSRSEASTIESLFPIVCREEQLTRNKERCFITKSTFDCLRKLGLPLTTSFFILVEDEYLFDDWGMTNNRQYYHENAQTFSEEDLMRLRNRFRTC